mmetsp:Transcript_25939/g.35810  ORF Transcript_25939/g.35810 Transcript_25939/m.35810 type:complete len:219 (+) Transcript_25939:1476-2132(+)
MPGVLVTLRSPPMIETRSFAMARPSPEPPEVREVDFSAWLKRAKMFCSLLSTMPTPVSRTLSCNSTVRLPCTAKPIAISISPFAVNLTALETRLMIICFSRFGSPRTLRGTLGSKLQKISRPSLPVWELNGNTASSMVSTMSSSRCSSSMVLVATRSKSSKLLMRKVRWLQESCSSFTHSLWSWSNSISDRMWTIPNMPFTEPLMSWEMLNRNSDCNF